MEACSVGTSAMAANPRRNSESAASGTTRAKLVNDRKARRRLSDHRKSGPKSSDLLHLRLEGKEGRRRLSEGRRRNSRNRAAMTRRERAYESAGMKRSMSRADTPGAKGAGAGFFMEVDETPLEEDQVENGVMTSEVETTGGSTWTSDMIAEASHGILSDDRNSQLRYARWLRLVLSESETSPAGEVVEAGLVPRLVDFLRSRDFPELVPEALCTLTNVAATEHAKIVAQEPNVLAIMVDLLQSADPYLREQSAWCLGNISGDCTNLRDLVLEAGVMEPLLVNLTSPSSPSLLRTGMWALGNCCRGIPPVPLTVVTPVLPVVRPVFCDSRADEKTLADAGWVLYHVTRGGTDRIDAVLSVGLLSRLPDFLLHESPEVVTPVLRTMDNLACSSGAHRGALIAAGVLDPLVEALGHESSKVRADVLRLLSSIAAGSYDQVAAVVSTPDVIPTVMTELEEGNAACRLEAAWVFLNMCQCGFEVHETIIPSMVEHGLLSAVCHSLDKQEEPESLVVMLGLLFTVLDEASREGGRLQDYLVLVDEANGLDRTLDLMNEHEDMEVYDKALDIVRAFVDGEDDEGIDDDDDDIERNGRKDDGDGDSDISDDSLSDDSFHPELNDIPATPVSPADKLPSCAGGGSIYGSTSSTAVSGSPINGRGNVGPSGSDCGDGHSSRSGVAMSWDETAHQPEEAYAAKGNARPQEQGDAAKSGGIVGAFERFISASVGDGQDPRSTVDDGCESGSKAVRCPDQIQSAHEIDVATSKGVHGHDGSPSSDRSQHSVNPGPGDSSQVLSSISPGTGERHDGRTGDRVNRHSRRGSLPGSVSSGPSMMGSDSGIAAALGIGDLIGNPRSRKSEVSRAPNARLMSAARGYDFGQTE